MLAACGHLHQAYKAYQPVVEIGGTVPVMALTYLDLGALRYEWNDLDKCAKYLNESIQLSERTTVGESRLSAHIQMARLLLAAGAIGATFQVQQALALADQSGATALAEQADENGGAHPFYLFQGLNPARLLLAKDQKSAARSYLNSCFEKATYAGWGYGLLANPSIERTGL